MSLNIDIKVNKWLNRIFNPVMNSVDSFINKHFTLKNFIYVIIILSIINIILGIIMESTPYPG